MGDSKVNFPPRTLNKFSTFDEFPEALIVNFVYLIEENSN